MRCDDIVSFREPPFYCSAAQKCLFPFLTVVFVAGEGQNSLNLSVKVVMIGMLKTIEKYFGELYHSLLSVISTCNPIC